MVHADERESSHDQIYRYRFDFKQGVLLEVAKQVSR